MLAWFDPETSMGKITANDAAEWEQWLSNQDISRATIKTHIGNAKSMFQAAVDRELIPRSPFLRLKGGTTASNGDRYITPREIDKLIEVAPDARWRVLIGLARLAGLRVPSETHLLTWQDVDWERSRLVVRSPKTERHEGHEQRSVPITSDLMRLLQDAFDEADEGQGRVVRIGRRGNLRRTMESIVKRSGVEPWPRLWQTLRASCEKEWAMSFPQYAVSYWIGHSITVSGKHYANSVPDEMFERAAKYGASKAVHNPVQKMHETSRNERKQRSGERDKDAKTPVFRGGFDKTRRVAEGIRTPDPLDHNQVL